MASTAAKVAAEKVAHPERFCSVKGCLWRTASSPCRKHPGASTGADVLLHRIIFPARHEDRGELPITETSP